MVVVVLAAAAIGCQSSGSSSSGDPQSVKAAQRLTPRTDPPIGDLPVPWRFKIDAEASRNYASAGVRYVEHMYTGSTKMDRVARFYLDNMPLNRWILMSENFVHGTYNLDYEKGSERCRLMIDRSWGKTYISAHIHNFGAFTSSSYRVNRPLELDDAAPRPPAPNSQTVAQRNRAPKAKTAR